MPFQKHPKNPAFQELSFRNRNRMYIKTAKSVFFLVLNHVQHLMQLAQDNVLNTATPLRILLLGTAGTGKTQTVQTTLQEIRRILTANNLPPEFVRCAAPTGTAALCPRTTS